MGFQDFGKQSGECPLCGKQKLDVTRKPNGRGYWVSCWVCEVNGITGAEYLAELAEAVGCAPYELIDDAPLHLDFLLDVPRAAGREPERLPSRAAIESWQARLLASNGPLRYLTKRRGLTVETLTAFGVGYDARRGELIFPAFVGDRVVYAYRRRPRDGAQMVAMSGRPRGEAIYPDLPACGALALVGGELDALTGRQLGLRAVTVSGCSLPDPALPHFATRIVYVMFDVGEERAADTAAGKLSDVGARARVVRLGLLGLPDKADLNDYVRQGGTARELKTLIRRERGQA
jgi:hypothetical protein